MKDYVSWKILPLSMILWFELPESLLTEQDYKLAAG